jgi:alpha-L-fucosidase
MISTVFKPQLFARLAGFVLLCVSVTLSAEPVRSRPDSAFILTAASSIPEVATAEEAQNWQIDLQHPGSYKVQLIYPLESARGALQAQFWVNGELQGNSLEKAYIIEDGLVAQFTSSVEFEQAAVYTIAVDSEFPPSQVRLVPLGYVNSRIYLSSQHYYDAWLKMHQSAPKQAAMKWYREAKFGMFIHWGVYSQAAGSWQGVPIEEGHGPKVAEWIQFAFDISREEYREYAKNFKPDQSFAVNIAKLAKATGMNYVVITSKHHDGFALFDSEHSHFDITEASPYEGDLIQELYQACRAEGLEFGVYYSHGNDWAEGGDGNYANVKARNDVYGVPTRPNGKNLWDPSPNSHADYLQQKAYPQIAELIRNLPDLRLIWFDGDGLITEKQAFDFYKLVYDLNPNIVVSRRVGYDFGDYIDAGDNKTPSESELAAKHFETCGTANHSWGFKAQDHEWQSGNQLLRNFVDIVSKGGNYLLNIGPDGAGRVPEPCVSSFMEMGEWVQTNREAIFGTTRWTTFREGVQRVKNSSSSPSEFWFSLREGDQDGRIKDRVYVMSLATPVQQPVQILSLAQSAGQVQAVRLLGSSTPLPWQQDSEGLYVDLTACKIGPNGYALEVVLD